jgi:hypothetical protein
VTQNTMTTPIGLELPQPEVVSFSREQKVLFWAPERLV